MYTACTFHAQGVSSSTVINLKVLFAISFKLVMLEMWNEVIPVSNSSKDICVEVEIVVEVYQTNNQSCYYLWCYMYFSFCLVCL